MTFLKENLMDEIHYNLVPEDAWKYFVKMYGIAEDQKAIQRKVHRLVDLFIELCISMKPRNK